jgi:hypothetical protein
MVFQNYQIPQVYPAINLVKKISIFLVPWVLRHICCIHKLITQCFIIFIDTSQWHTHSHSMRSSSTHTFAYSTSYGGDFTCCDTESVLDCKSLFKSCSNESEAHSVDVAGQWLSRDTSVVGDLSAVITLTVTGLSVLVLLSSTPEPTPLSRFADPVPFGWSCPVVADSICSVVLFVASGVFVFWNYHQISGMSLFINWIWMSIWISCHIRTDYIS